MSVLVARLPLARRVPVSLAAAPPLADVVGVLVIAAFTVIALLDLVRGGTMTGQDTTAFFYPMYSVLGEGLRAGHLPRWNPHQLAGAPFAADPQSGWMYLPAMALFALLPLNLAAQGFMALHLLMAGLGTYALARVLGMNVAGALVAAVAYEFTGWQYGRSPCCPIYVQAGAWLPLLLLGTELALRSRSGLARGCWWAGAGLALSQVFAGWPGQGSYYTVLVLGGYVAYRALLVPVTPETPLSRRLGSLALHGGMVLLFGFGFVAAGLLPRLEFQAVSNLAEGYQGWADSVGGWTPQSMIRQLFGRSWYYAGGATLTLAIVGPLVARARLMTPYFALVALVALVLAAKQATPLHALFNLLPFFEEFHNHYPERIMLVFYLAVALLAGATVSSFQDWTGRGGTLMAIVLAPVIVVVIATPFLRGHKAAIPPAALQWIVLAGLVAAACAIGTRLPIGRVLPAVLVLVVAADLLAAGHYLIEHRRFGTRFDLGAYDTPSGAAAFLRSQPADGPFRFFGYDPDIDRKYAGQRVLYRFQFGDPESIALLVNNRAMLLGLEDIQGYNSVQIARYVDIMAALNGRSQEYRSEYVLEEGIGSPLLDLLNVRYIVVPAETPSDRADLQALRRDHPVVYEDDLVAVLENPEALPRAWLVHEARQAAPGEALPLLASRAVDPRQTVLLEEAPPSLRQPADAMQDRVTLASYDDDRIRLQTNSEAAGVVVLSEVHYPAWNAYVDGKPVPLYVANHALRAVPVEAGTHQVELRYESQALRLGTIITLAFVTAAFTLLIATSWYRRKEIGRFITRDRPVTASP